MISARNYAAQAERALRSREGMAPQYEGQDVDLKISQGIVSYLKKAVHFAMPDGGTIFDDNLRGLHKTALRLPYPIITVEYFVPLDFGEIDPLAPVYSPKRLVLATETTCVELRASITALGRQDASDHLSSLFDDNEHLISIFVFYEVEGVWIFHPMGFVISEEWQKPDDMHYQVEEPLIGKRDPNRAAISAVPIHAQPFLYDEYVKNGCTRKAMFHDTMSDVVGLMELCEALTCSNITTDVLQASNDAVNERRARKHKLPLYETKTLVLKAPGGTVESVRGNGTHRSPRQHLRRGHIRRLPDRNVWVNSCVVGSSSEGQIDKSYQVIPGVV